MDRFRRCCLCAAVLCILFLVCCSGVFAAESNCDHVYETITEAATCTNPGMTYDRCSLCGKTTNYANTPPLGHSFGAWAVAKEVSCAHSGLEVRICSVCGYQEEQQVDALGHTYESSIVSPTCTKQGYTYHVCGVCTDSYKSDYVDALGHDYVSSVVSETCEKQGYTHYACSVCGDTYKAEYVDAAGHRYTAQVVAPTRTARGFTLYTCSVCGDSYKSDYVPATGSQSSGNTGSSNKGSSNTSTGQSDHTGTEGTNAQKETVPQQTEPERTEAGCWYLDPFRWLTNSSGAQPPVPDRGFTRAQIVTLLWRCCGSPEPVGCIHPYVDLRSDAACYDAVLWAYEQGIARGIDAHRFAPDAVPPRRQVISMFYWVVGES